jgi:ribosomal protein L22
MANEQDVFISGISGSIQQWSTEATASKIEGTLKQISAQNASIIGLLNAVKGGGSMSSKELRKVGAELRTNNVKQDKSQKADTIEKNQTQSWLGKMTSTLGSLTTTSKNTKDVILQDYRASRKEASDMKQLMQTGLSQTEAKKVVDGDKQKFKMEKAIAAGTGLIALLATVQEATRAGFEQRYDMASELRQSGLMDGLSGLNEGFIGIAKTISETGFTFGMAAEFTKEFSKTVGILGVKSTLDFVNSLARGDDGLMKEFAMSFGDASAMAGEYLDTLRISGQLAGRSDQQLRKGMNSFMSNVTATANVLKISMTEAAALMKNSMSDVEKGMLLTLPKAMQESVRGAMAFAGGVDNPLTELLSARLGAGSQGGFQLTSSFQDTSQTALGMEMIKFVNQAASQLETGGDAQFQSFMSTQMPEFIAGELARYQGAGARGMALSDERILVMLSQMNQLAQNMTEINQGISGGGTADQSVVASRDQQLYAIAQGEGAMNSVMEGFTTNLEKLTESNFATSTAIANSITSNANLIDTANNLATTVDRTMNTVTRGLLHVANISGEIVTFGQGTENAEFMQASQFRDGTQLSGWSQNENIVGDFSTDSAAMLKVITQKDEKGTITDQQIKAQIKQYQDLTATLLQTAGGNEKSNGELQKTSEKTLAALTALIGAITTE